MLITILAFVLVLGVLIFVHELGHFLTAKAVDIEVPRFSIGLGPVAFGFRRGETEYVVSWLPLGGYVKMAGMEEMEQIEGGPARREQGALAGTVSDAGLMREEVRRSADRTFESKSLSARALVISSGVIMNFLFAIAAFGAIAFIWGVEPQEPPVVGTVLEPLVPETSEALLEVPVGARIVEVAGRQVDTWRDVQQALLLARAGTVEIRFADRPSLRVELPANEEERARLAAALVPERDPIIGQVLPGSPAAAAGLRRNDRILAVDGEPVRTWHDMAGTFEVSAGQRLTLLVRRGAETFETVVVPERDTLVIMDRAQEVGRIGVAYAARARLGPVAAAGYGVAETGRWTVLIVDVLRGLIVGDISPRQLGGPVMIGQYSGEAARAGLDVLINFMALLSVNLAVLNLLPIPILDGGQLVFLAMEAIRGRPLRPEQRARLAQVGLVMIVMIMVWAFASDIMRVFGL